MRKVFLWRYADDTTYHGLHRVRKVEELLWRLAVLLRMPRLPVGKLLDGLAAVRRGTAADVNPRKPSAGTPPFVLELPGVPRNRTGEILEVRCRQATGFLFPLGWGPGLLRRLLLVGFLRCVGVVWVQFCLWGGQLSEGSLGDEVVEGEEEGAEAEVAVPAAAAADGAGADTATAAGPASSGTAAAATRRPVMAGDEEDFSGVEGVLAAVSRAAEQEAAAAGSAPTVDNPLYVVATSCGREVHPSVAFLIKERAALLLWGPHTITLFPGLYALYMSAQPGAATLRMQSTVEQSWTEDKHAELPGAVPRGGRGSAGQGMSLLCWLAG